MTNVICYHSCTESKKRYKLPYLQIGSRVTDIKKKHVVTKGKTCWPGEIKDTHTTIYKTETQRGSTAHLREVYATIRYTFMRKESTKE